MPTNVRAVVRNTIHVVNREGGTSVPLLAPASTQKVYRGEAGPRALANWSVPSVRRAPLTATSSLLLLLLFVALLFLALPFRLALLASFSVVWLGAHGAVLEPLACLLRGRVA
jgi:hypothetical protein